MFTASRTVKPAQVSLLRRPGRVLPGAPGSRVTRLELFYDLVFVFAFLNVTTLLAERLTGFTLFGGLVVLALLWWCWTSFAALGNVVRADQGMIPLVGMVTVAALFVLAVAIPEVFTDLPGGVRGPLVFVACYLVIRGIQVAVLVAQTGPRRQDLLRFGIPVTLAAMLILISALLPAPFASSRSASYLRLGLWTVAVLVEFLAGARLRHTDLPLISAGHWAERYALIVLIALGESIISLGAGPRLGFGPPITWPVIIASALGIAVVGALWWMYFDTLAPALEQTLHRTRDPTQRARLARDAYAYLHLPMIAGIIGVALGLKRYLGAIADAESDPWLVRAEGLDHLVLFGGATAFVAALIALGLRIARRIRPAPIITFGVLVISAPLAGRLPAVAGIALLATICVTTVLVGLRASDPLRSRVRRIALEEQLAAERMQTEWRGRHL